MKGIVLILLSFVIFADSNPFFGNDYVIPQVPEMSKSALAIVTSLNSAQSSVNNYIRFPPRSEVYIFEGTTTLTNYVGNVTRLISPFFSQLNTALNDRRSEKITLFLRMSQSISLARPFLNNSTIYTNAILENLGPSSGEYFTNFNLHLNSTMNDLAATLENISKIIEENRDQKLSTQQFLYLFIDSGDLPKLEGALSEFQFVAQDYMEKIAELVRNINNANTFKVNFNSRFITARNSINASLNSYITASNNTFNLLGNAVNVLSTYINSQQEAFLFRWPTKLNTSVEEYFLNVTTATEVMSKRIVYARIHLQSYHELIRNEFINDATYLQFLRTESDTVTRYRLDISPTSLCLTEYSTALLERLNTAQNRLSAAFTTQNNVERDAIAISTNTLNGFLRTYTTSLYTNLNICFSYPFRMMDECLLKELRGQGEIARFPKKLSSYEILLSHYAELFVEFMYNSARLYDFFTKNNVKATCLS